ncbi:Arylsulfatase [Anaerohalosphaera lusitana]|uniref:Arylsulfatase n=1 Tax=Anaerohalosphaera lusitana TaxID=1936003 RepID=A0A1U9NIC8_9BACT|nr:sulfatase/phosphatase domain-containing protein [Anaerohalosphaera lusitana]AQT67575.1 Arylsulfatase [Anaerohalosphaera lusitana]
MKPITRRNFLKVAGISAAAVSLPGCAGQFMTQKPKRKPNIVFIMTDDHASHALSCYGSKINKTPNLDRIAEEGMRFDNCFCTNSICAPSRAVILTGKYSHINGKIDNTPVPFDGSQQTFPKLLRKAGYQTAMIGKWHLRSEPTGFDYWNVLPGQGAYHNPVMIEMGERKKYDGYVTDIITDKAIDWIEQRNNDQPFCLLYQHKAPHRNWQPDEKHADMYKDRKIPLPETFNDDYATRSDAAREQEMTIEKHLRVPYDTKVKPPEELSGQELKEWKYQRYMEDYLACVASVDDNVGRFLDYLEEKGLAEDTVIVYTSDQGFYLGDHGWFDKRFMYEESLRMPFLVKYPGLIKPGSVNKDIVVNIDFAPTFVDMAEARIPNDMQGRSLMPLLAGDTPDDWRTAMYYHYYEYPAVHQVKRHYGIRTKRYKLIHFYNDIDAWELYDLKKDPNELNNIYGNPQYSDLVTKLKSRLEDLREKYGDSDELTREVINRRAKKG